MARVYEISFSIAGRMANTFNGAFSSASNRMLQLNQQTNSLRTGLRNLERVQQQVANRNELQEQIASTSQEFQEARIRVNRLAAELLRTQNPTRELQQQFRQAESEANRLNGRLTSQRENLQRLEIAISESGASTRDLTRDYANLSSQLAQAEQAQRRFSELQRRQGQYREQRTQIKEQIGSTAEKGVAMSAPFVVATVAALNYQETQKQLQIQGNMRAKQSQEAFNVVRQAYLSGLGEDVQTTANSYGLMSQIMKRESMQQQKVLLQGALVLEKYWQQDTQGVSQAVQNLTTNFKNLSNMQAMDIVTAGFQNGLNYADDYLDTLTEYAPQFESLGYSAKQFYSILAAGKSAGAFNLDKVADAVKEFNIRGKDGSKTTADGFKMIGLDADKMADSIAAGGEKGVKAFNQTIQALQKIKDPVKQNQAGVALFGTQWEDLTSKVVLGMNVSTDAADKVAGSTQKVVGAATDAANGTASWSQLGRSIQETAAIVGDSLLPVVTPLVKDLNSAALAAADFAKKYPDLTRALATGMTGLIGARIAWLGLKLVWKSLLGTGTGLRLILEKIGMARALPAVGTATAASSGATVGATAAGAGAASASRRIIPRAGDVRAGYQLMRESGAGRARSVVSGIRMAREVPTNVAAVRQVAQPATRVVQNVSRLTPALSRALPVVGKAVGKLALPVAIASEVYDISRSQNKVQAVAKSAAGLGGGAVGAKVGAAIGTAILPGIGTAVGAAVGGLGGYIAGKWVAGKATDAVSRPPTPPQTAQAKGSMNTAEYLNAQLYQPFASIVSRSDSWGRNLIGNFCAGRDSAGMSMNGWLNSQVYSPFASVVSRSVSWGRNLIGNFCRGRDSAGMSMNGWLNSQVYIPFASIVSRAPSWGRNLIGNFVAGMDSSASNLSSEVTKLTNLVEAQFRKNLGIASPSKVTFGIGRFVMQGLINGMSSVDIQKFTKKQMDALIGSMGTSGGNATGWLTAALFATGTPMSWLPGLQRLAQAESSGNPLARNSKSVGGEHATGLLQTLPSTFRGYANPGMGNILNPVHNAAAAINYIKSRYGSVYNTPLFHSNGAYVGYADGGFADRPSIFGEAGMEAAIPIRPGNQRSIGLLNKTAQMLGIQPQEQDMREGLNFDTLFSRLFETRSESSNEPNIVINANFAPVIHGVNKTEIMPALKEQEQSFLGELEEIVRRVIKSEKHDRERVAYG